MRTRTQRLLNIVQRPDVYEEALIGSSGASIALSFWRGERGPVRSFLAGTMTHPQFYEEFLDGLSRAGFNVVGVHFRRHGKSPRTNRLFSFEDRRRLPRRRGLRRRALRGRGSRAGIFTNFGLTVLGSSGTKVSRENLPLGQD